MASIKVSGKRVKKLSEQQALAEAHPGKLPYRKPEQSSEIDVVPEDQMCTIPGCSKRKLKESTLCKRHKCANDECQKCIHPKHGVFCKEHDV
jgi:hypothetical protein